MSKQTATQSQLQLVREEIDNKILSCYSEHLQIYVDGSVDPDSGRAGSAFIAKYPDNSIYKSGARISNWVSSTQAEVAAIFLALSHIQLGNSRSEIVIFCDSMAAIQQLQSRHLDPLNPLVYDTLKLFHHLLVNKNISVTIYWIPSHIGIKYNELVDRTANEWSNKTNITLNLPVTVGQIKAGIKRFFKIQTLSKLESIGNSSANLPTNSLAFRTKQYLVINPTVKPQPQVSSKPQIQKDINRLRLATNTWCCSQHQTPMSCSYCSLPFTPAHYLITCPVTSSGNYKQCLSPDEHSYKYPDMNSLILNRLSKMEESSILTSGLSKRPIKTFCPCPDHGESSDSFILIPRAL